MLIKILICLIAIPWLGMTVYLYIGLRKELDKPQNMMHPWNDVDRMAEHNLLLKILSDIVYIGFCFVWPVIYAVDTIAKAVNKKED